MVFCFSPLHANIVGASSIVGSDLTRMEQEENKTETRFNFFIAIRGEEFFEIVHMGLNKSVSAELYKDF